MTIKNFQHEIFNDNYVDDFDHALDHDFDVDPVLDLDFQSMEYFQDL